jgi:cytoskeletal protein CcmA (bactofilin family)
MRARLLRESLAMTTLGPTVVVKGELRTFEDLTLEGRIEGPVWCDGSVVLTSSADVAGDIIARDITVFGRFTGQLVATEVIDIRADATVKGRVVTNRLILDDGAHFEGRSEPQHLEAALRVAQFQQRRRDASPVSARGGSDGRV